MLKVGNLNQKGGDNDRTILKLCVYVFSPLIAASRRSADNGCEREVHAVFL